MINDVFRSANNGDYYCSTNLFACGIAPLRPAGPTSSLFQLFVYPNQLGNSYDYTQPITITVTNNGRAANVNFPPLTNNTSSATQTCLLFNNNFGTGVVPTRYNPIYTTMITSHPGATYFLQRNITGDQFGFFKVIKPVQNTQDGLIHTLALAQVDEKQEISLKEALSSQTASVMSYDQATLNPPQPVVSTSMGAILTLDIRYNIIITLPSYRQCTFSPLSTYGMDTNFTYPFGVSHVSSGGITKLSFSFYASRYIPDSAPPKQLDCYFGSPSIPFVSGSTFNLPDTTPPSIQTLELVPVGGNKYLLRSTLGDNESGFVRMLLFFSSGELYSLDHTDRYQGSSQLGKYEKLVTLNCPSGEQPKYSAFIFDKKQAAIMDFGYNAGSFGHPYGFTTSQFVIGAEDLSVFYFDNYLMNVSSTHMVNTLYLNSTKIIPSWIVTLVYGSIAENQYYEAAATYDVKRSLFVIQFMVPGKTMTRQMQYYIRVQLPGDNFYLPSTNTQGLFAANLISSDLIMKKFPTTSVISIISTYGDEMPPMITSCVAHPSRSVAVVTGSTSIGWNITIEDSPNGFSRGVINVVSDIDGLERRFEITPANRTSGDLFKGTYQILFAVDSNFGNQTFTFLDIELFDTSMNRAQYLTYSSDQRLVSPLSYLMEADKILEFNIQLTTSSTDITPPTVVTMETLTPTVDVGSHMRQVQVRFMVRDTGSGVSMRHMPAIYITGYLFETFKLDTTFISQSGTDYSFMATGQLPYGFAVSTIGPNGNSSTLAFVSIYGLVDNSQNLIGYSTVDLDVGIPDVNKTIAIKYTHNIPIIEDYSIDNGVITIFGKNFGDDIALSDLTKGMSFTKTFGSVVIAAFNITEVDTTKVNITLQLSTNQYSSNIVVIQYRVPPTTPIVIPTVSCPGNPPCSNHGLCSSTFGCQCTGSWYGQDCSSESIPSTPVINDDTPTIVYAYNISGETIIGDIEIVRVRILNTDGAELASYPLSQWSVTNLSAQSRDYTTRYGPSDNIGMIKVNVKWFTEDEDVKFAGDILPIKRNTIKYTITLSNYTFPSQLDSMQVVMRAAINTTDSNSCSVQQYGYVNGSQDNLFWMRVKVQSYSLYGHFIQKALVDGRVSTVTNVLVSDQSQSVNDTQSSQTMIGFNVRSFEQQAILDPDFHLLMDIDNAESNDGAVCNHRSSSKKLSTLAIVGIAVLCVVVVVAIIVSVLIWIYRERKVIFIFKLMRLGRKSNVNQK
ncbi:hypothetical protein SAMD00019534_065190 [Acytostelium subglobosum LB1]|uniref:hypothetical protein n=1 Tax=Acytostelium subglobosum LB1 TaxID=1410327 RepID=UPI0006447D0D|nr:hypothetical protein SAMD00019534_065190 [Acytostelium subglobosum LB1]GAM23344.1 hypothetical protein SAMD00019534_065190 [Acytostelium subglobosum LB1]|eukprot:XP_012753793.1 hypothetical protein SAMD00019534_065190 [Acytostelium subglobosum LB1]